MLKRVCDRCNREIIDNYWTIDIYQHEDRSGKVSATGAVNNIKQNVDKILDRKKEYCEECIKEIKEEIGSVIK